NTGYSTHAYGPQMDVRTDNNNSEVGDVMYGGPFLKYRMTSSGIYRTTTSGEFYSFKAPYFYTIVPFTTGTVTAVEPHGGQLSEFTLHGYDNRTPLGENGIISMVRPRIRHVYQVPRDVQEPITMSWANIEAWQMDFHFRPVPEPGSTVMFASGFLAIAGLYRLRRR
ncbi:MAG: PEP-CTERM sorting domain-containing protein, partial [Deltaproteobacteria bacterium]|nr:PEP-CTERM sorting domain-containing protein [Deltaproteobacteria bacterium]